jgi:hypothetical protein
MAALMVIMVLLILLAKIVELLFRLIAKVDFDESRSPRNTGLLGAMRKKELIGAGRRRRRRKTGQNSRKSQSATPSLGPTMRAEALAFSPSRASFGQHAGYETGYLTPSNRLARPSHGRDADDENENIMSAFRSRPQSTVYGPVNHFDTGYVQPGSYAAAAPPSSGFRVVRGGRATDDSPYTMAQSLPPGAAPPPMPSPRAYSQGSESLQNLSTRPPVQRNRASSQSAIVEDTPASPTIPAWNRRLSAIDPPRSPGADKFDRRLSAPLPLSPSTFPSGAPISMGPRPAIPRQLSTTTPGWRRESSTGSGFFSSLFRGPTKSEENEDAWSDSDDSDGGQQRSNAFKRRWHFGKGKGKGMSTEGGLREETEQYEVDPEWEEALADEDADTPEGDGGPSSSKGFQVIRKPMHRPSAE